MHEKHGKKEQGALAELAADAGLVLHHTDGFGAVQQPDPDAVRAVLAGLGAPANTALEARERLLERRAARAERALEPVLVAWGRPERSATTAELPPLRLTVQAEEARGRYCLTLIDEQGNERRERGRLDARRSPELPDGYCVAELPALSVPFGYHELTLQWADRQARSLVIAAPARLPRQNHKQWGVFAPTYALRSSSDRGMGSLRELSALCEFTERRGGAFVATLPMLAQFLGSAPFDSSPYAPASRLFWNELLLDVSRLPEFRHSPEARRALSESPWSRQLSALRARDSVDHRRMHAHLWPILQRLAGCWFARGGMQDPAFRDFLEEHPYAEEYARYRGTVQKAGDDFRGWNEETRLRFAKGQDVASVDTRTHLYAQWRTAQQLSHVAREGEGSFRGLYLDLPLGVHPGSFDVAAEQECFVRNCEVGAPPDPLCLDGQTWGFHPSHPEGEREQGYRYFRACIREQLRYAALLRIDHVMGLHRLFCVPRGFSATTGVYLSQRADERWAVLLLEASRAGAQLIGEDLGVVPDEVRARMARHRVFRLHVLPFEADAGTPNPPEDALATLNTHDMPPFASLFDERGQPTEQGASVVDSVGLPAGAPRTRVLDAALDQLGRSDARLVQVSLEDLWAETRPQNVPGTVDEGGNWCRRARHAIEEFPRLGEPRRLLGRLDAARRAAPTPKSLDKQRAI